MCDVKEVKTGIDIQVQVCPRYALGTTIAGSRELMHARAIRRN